MLPGRPVRSLLTLITSSVDEFYNFEISNKLFLDTYPFITFPKVCFNVSRPVLSQPLPIHINPLSLSIDKIHRLSYTSEVYSNLLKSLVQIVIPWKSMYLCVYTCHLRKMRLVLIDKTRFFEISESQSDKSRNLGSDSWSMTHRSLELEVPFWKTRR